MIKVSTRIDTDLTVVIEECYLEVELGMNRIIEEGHSMLIVIEMTLGEEILGKCKIIEIRIIEVDIETTIEMAILEEVEVCLGKDNTQVTLEGMIKAVVDQGKVQEPNTNRYRIRCSKYREYDHLANDCLNSETEGE